MVQINDGGVLARRIRALQATGLDSGCQQGMPGYEQRRFLIDQHRASRRVKSDDT